MYFTLDCSDNDQWMVLVGFARYALGRRSMAPGLAIGIIQRSWHTMNQFQRERIKTDISEAIELGLAGSPVIDVPGWKTILTLPDTLEPDGGFSELTE